MHRPSTRTPNDRNRQGVRRKVWASTQQTRQGGPCRAQSPPDVKSPAESARSWASCAAQSTSAVSETERDANRCASARAAHADVHTRIVPARTSPVTPAGRRRTGSISALTAKTIRSDPRDRAPYAGIDSCIVCDDGDDITPNGQTTRPRERPRGRPAASSAVCRSACFLFVVRTMTPITGYASDPLRRG